MRTWMRLIPAVLLAIPVSGSVLRADAESDRKIDSLQKDVAELRKDVDRLRKDLTDAAVQHGAVLEQLRAIDKALERIARDQDRISRYGPASLPPGGAPPAPLPNTGTVTVQNHYGAPATVHINGQPYEVRVGQTRAIFGVPTGRFQYSVDVEGFGTVDAPRTDSLPSAGYRITIFPRY